MAPFPTSRSNKAIAPLTNQTVTAILQVVNNTSLEALEYATENIITAHKNSGSPSANLETINKLVEHTHHIRRLYDNMVSPWDLQRWEDKNIVQMYNEVLTDEAVSNLAGNLPKATEAPVNMFYAIDENGQFLRVYLENEEVLDEERTQALDALWNLWLTQNNMICQDGFIYRTDKNGVNTKERIPKTELDARIPGLEGFLTAKNINVSVTRYGEEAPEAAPSAKAETAVSQKST